MVVRVEPSGPDNPVVDIEKIKKALAASGYGVIGDDKGETVTDKPHTNGTVVNQDVVSFYIQSFFNNKVRWMYKNKLTR